MLYIRFLEVQLEDALAVAAEMGIYAYDAYVLVAAEKQRCPLLTLDHGLISAARGHGVEVVEIAS